MSVFSNDRGHGKTANGGSGHRESDRLREDIDATHRRLEGLLGELDRRRREAFDIRLQMRRHPVIFAAGAALALGALGGGTALAISRMRRAQRRRHSPSLRLMRLWRLSGPPVDGANASPRAGWLLSLAAKVATAILVRRLGGRRRPRD
jgi:hypothetical protein